MVLVAPVNARQRVQPELVGVPGMVWSKLLVVAVFAPEFASLWLLRPPRHRDWPVSSPPDRQRIGG